MYYPILHNVTAFSSFASSFLYSKFDPYRFAEVHDFFQQSLMAFFMRISKLFSKKVHSRPLMSKNEVLYNQNHIRSFNNMVFG